MKFQLVLQFEAFGRRDFDDLVSLEEKLNEIQLPTFQIDGHDFGTGEFNIFILTDQPRETFCAVHALVQQRQPRGQLKAAYREIGEDQFVILWPTDLNEFTVS